MKSHSYTEEVKHEAVRRYRAGEKPGALAKEFKLTNSVLYTWNKDPRYNGTQPEQAPAEAAKSGKPNMAKSRAFKKKIVARYHAGESSDALGKEIHMSGASVLHWAKDPRYKSDPAEAVKAAAASVPILNYCPNCGFGIGHVTKALYALNKVGGGK